MKLTILGNNGPFPAAGGACSGYLLRHGDKNILLDCGNGVLANLQKHIEIENIDAVILTHLHSDHISDMMVLRYAIQIKRKNGFPIDILDVYAPDEPEGEYGRLDDKAAFNLRPINDDSEIVIGDIKLRFRKTKHPYKCYAVSARADGKKLVYSGDTAWDEGLTDFFMDSDVIMLDSGLLSKDKKDDSAVHMTAEECGIMACRSNAGKLILTHFWPGYEINELVDEAKTKFNNVAAAHIGHSYII